MRYILVFFRWPCLRRYDVERRPSRYLPPLSPHRDRRYRRRHRSRLIFTPRWLLCACNKAGVQREQCGPCGEVRGLARREQGCLHRRKRWLSPRGYHHRSVYPTCPPSRCFRRHITLYRVCPQQLLSWKAVGREAGGVGGVGANGFYCHRCVARRYGGYIDVKVFVRDLVCIGFIGIAGCFL